MNINSSFLLTSFILLLFISNLISASTCENLTGTWKGSWNAQLVKATLTKHNDNYAMELSGPRITRRLINLTCYESGRLQDVSSNLHLEGYIRHFGIHLTNGGSDYISLGKTVY